MARGPQQRGQRRDRDEAPEFADRLVAINRVSKTVKGGKRFGFAALVVVWLAAQLSLDGYAKFGQARDGSTGEQLLAMLIRSHSCPAGLCGVLSAPG